MTDVAEHLKDLEHALRIAADDDEKFSVIYEIGVVIGGFTDDATAQFAIDRYHDIAVDMPHGLDEDRVTRALGEGRSEGRRLAEQRRVENLELDRHVVELDAKAKEAPRCLDYVRASDVAAEKIEWDWPGRIARGKHTLVAGDPGTGKSQLMVSVVSTVTTGGFWPCDEGRAQVGSVIILQAEDGVGDTLIPRLLAAGADNTRVHIIKATRIKGVAQTFDLHADLDLLKRLIRDIGDVRLVCIDPISSYMGGKVDSHKNSEVRSTLEPVGRLGEECGVAIFSVTHFNKGAAGGSVKALYRVVGSIAFVGAPRAAFVVTEDPDDKGRCLFLQVKNNIAPPQKGLAFRKMQTVVGDDRDIVASYIGWDPNPVTITADGAVGGGSDTQLTTTDLAVEFLQTALANGSMGALDVQAEAIAAGLLKSDQPIGQAKPFRDARDILGVVTHREGFGPGAKYHWALPSAPWVPSPPMDAPSQEQGIHGPKGHP